MRDGKGQDGKGDAGSFSIGMGKGERRYGTIRRGIRKRFRVGVAGFPDVEGEDRGVQCTVHGALGASDMQVSIILQLWQYSV